MPAKKILIVLLFGIIILPQVTIAQECDPFCPVCSGTGSSTSALVSSGVIIPNILYIPQGEEETGVVNLRSGITSWLDVGVGYGVKLKNYSGVSGCNQFRKTNHLITYLL